MCFNQRGNIFTLNGNSLKQDKFTYQRSSVSSTETDINTRLAKVWTAIDMLSIIRKTDLTDKLKRWNSLNAVKNIEQVLEVALNKTEAVRQLTTHHKNYPS